MIDLRPPEGPLERQKYDVWALETMEHIRLLNRQKTLTEARSATLSTLSEAFAILQALGEVECTQVLLKYSKRVGEKLKKHIP